MPVQGTRQEIPEMVPARFCAQTPERAQSPRHRGGPPGRGAPRPLQHFELEDLHMNTRTIAVVALVIAVVLLLFFVILPRM